MQVHRIPFAAQRVMPWKNGGGSTREVAIAPSASAPAGFTWRVSVASVAADGPFSAFPGVDRSLWLLRGNGMVLDVAGREVRLERAWQRFDFAGETPIHARLIDGGNEDLNVMVERATTAAEAAIAHLAPRELRTCVLVAGAHIVLALTGELQVDGIGLVPGDAMRCLGAGKLSLLAAANGASLLVASFCPRGPG